MEIRRRSPARCTILYADGSFLQPVCFGHGPCGDVRKCAVGIGKRFHDFVPILDDYGVGYSNIQRLRALPLNIIKIDKSMVDDMFTMDGEVIIENTVRMMKGIRKELVVEGVETEKEAKACEELSCDYIQGFYYARPLPAEEFVRFLREHNKAAPPEVGKT